MGAIICAYTAMIAWELLLGGSDLAAVRWEEVILEPDD